jgi:hypothetical protein
MYFQVASCGFELPVRLNLEAAVRAGAPVLQWQLPVPPGVVKSPPPRRHKPLLVVVGLLAQPPLRLVEAVYVPMLARRAQLELRAQLPALQAAVRQ